MSKIIPIPPEIEIDFTDARLTGQGGCALLELAWTYRVVYRRRFFSSNGTGAL